MKITYFEEIDSTNTFLKNKENKENWEVVYAECQTAGRGRRDKYWFSGKGGAWFSIAVKVEKHMKIEDILKFPFIVCFSVIKELESLAGLNLQYKWTNDIYYENRKLAGILVEKSGEFVILGVGINVNNREFGDFENTACSLIQKTKKEFDVKEVILKISNKIQESFSCYFRGEWEEMISFLRDKNFLNGKKIVVKKENSEIEGVCSGISSNGYLLVNNGENIIEIDSGDIIWN